MIEKHQKKLGIAAAVIILLFSIGLRINSPKADLPSHITFSGSILTDEGNQCHNSRSKALYNEWYPDDWRITSYNPLLPYMKYAIFKIFGVGLWQLRSISFIFAFLSLLLFFLTLKSYYFLGHFDILFPGKVPLREKNPFPYPGRCLHLHDFRI